MWGRGSSVIGARAWQGGRTKLRRAFTALTGFALILMVNGPAWAEDPMSFRLVGIGADARCKGSCAEVIVAEGEITNDTADSFLAFLQSHLEEQELRPVVLIQSPGGTVVGSMKLGTVFRKIGAAVIVAAVRERGDAGVAAITPAACLSACVYAFMGGKKRVVPSVSRLGIHRMVITEHVHSPSGGTESERTFGSQEFVATLSSYARSMGINPDVIAYAETISPDALHIVSAKEIARWRLGSPRL